MEEIISFDPVQFQILLYVAIAMALGAVVGLDREMADKPAGVRTNMLVAGSACLLVSLGQLIVARFSVGPDAIMSDPIRIIDAIVTGISFIGAGIIIRRGSDRVEGITTAATILFVASLGVCVALAQIPLAVFATVLALFTLRGMKYILRYTGIDRGDTDKHECSE